MSWHLGRMAAFDTETTGTDVETDRIVSAALITPAGVREWLTDVDGVEIPAEATSVHHMSTEHAREHGRPAKEVVEEIAEVLAAELNAGSPLVVMNAPFDLTILDRECTRHGVPTLTEKLDGKPIGPVVDPLVMDRAADKYRKGPRKLENLAAHYGIELTNAHAAAADAQAALDVARRIFDMYPQLRAPAELLHRWQIGWFATWAEGFEQYLRKKDPTEVVDRNWPLIPAPAFGGVTSNDVLRGLAQGLDHPQIAELFDITVRASRLLLRRAFDELGAQSGPHAIALAIGLGQLPADVATNPAPQSGGQHEPVRQ
ncbi:exonuclease domain-containing protein [Kitasatospora sp. NPDC059408]|uniref:exonuclease domain-containing protein n=1 Tax=Kitasatospora sp. NPDC059408 TaxID=3346823 RepID=UPI00367B0BBD